MPRMSLPEASFCRSAPWQRIVRRIVPWATQGVPLTSDVLELGGGSGAMAEEILRADPRVRLTVTDIDPEMVRAAQERFACCPRATVHQADATQLPYDDESFDAATSFLMLHHVIEWEDAVAEVSRVLRPQGLFVGYDLVSSRAATLVHRIDRSPHRFIERGALEPVLARAGLDVLDVKYPLYGLTVRFAARKR